MTASVIHLDDHRLHPHLSGWAQCQACEHRWACVAPVGVIHLECPKCEAMNGVWRNGVEPNDGESFWTCSCGEALFWITPNHDVHCRRCGRVQEIP